MKIFTIQYLVFCGFTMLIFGCQDNPSHSHDENTIMETEAPHQHSEDQTDIISVTPEQYNASSFEVSPFVLRPFNKTLLANGRIHLPEKNKAIVSSLIGGTVSNIDLIHGQWVKKGQHLFDITNPDLLNIQLEYLELQGRMKFLETEASRLKLLSEENITAKKNHLRAESDYKVAMSTMAILKSKLILFGLIPEEISDSNLKTRLTSHAPISGYITDISVLQGGFLPATEAAIQISNTNHLHAELKVLEKDISFLKREQKISFYIQGHPNKTLKASIHQIENKIDENRMINIHCHIDSDTGLRLIPGMSIRGEIDVEVIESYALPTEAILANEGKTYILQQLENKPFHYEAKEVQIGSEENGFTQIINSDNFQASATYLTKGAYLAFAPDEEGVRKGHSH